MYKIYGADGCAGCKAAKQLLDGLNLPYNYVDVHEVELSETDMNNLRGKRTLPAVYVEYGGQDVFVGGFAELRERCVSA